LWDDFPGRRSRTRFAPGYFLSGLQPIESAFTRRARAPSRQVSVNQRLNSFRSLQCTPSGSPNLTKIIAAKERKEHKDKEKIFYLCALCALLRPIRFGCGSAALRLCIEKIASGDSESEMDYDQIISRQNMHPRV
jgi:hypothetical protein